MRLARSAAVALLALAAGSSGSAPPALAQQPPAIARYVPAAPDPRHVFVLDSAHVLRDATVAELDARAHALQRETEADVVLVTLPTLGGRSIRDASLYLGRTWGVGSLGRPGDPDRNRGLVVIYVPDRTTTTGPNIRVEVGQGLEGTITDARSHEIIRAMKPALAAKRYDAAFLAGFDSAAAMVRDDFVREGRQVTAAAGTPASVAPPAGHRPPASFALAFALVALPALLLVLVVRRVKRDATGGRRRPEPESDDSGRPVLVLPAPPADPDPSRRRPFGDAWVSSLDSSPSSEGGSDGGGGESLGGGGGFSGGGSDDTV